MRRGSRRACVAHVAALRGHGVTCLAVILDNVAHVSLWRLSAVCSMILCRCMVFAARRESGVILRFCGGVNCLDLRIFIDTRIVIAIKQNETERRRCEPQRRKAGTATRKPHGNGGTEA